MGFRAMETYDAIVIGAGEAGAILGSYAVAAGSRVAMIYREPYGSTCVNVGCVPSKFLIARARVAHVVRTAERFHVRTSEPTVALGAIVAEKNELIAEHRAEGLGAARRAERLTLLEGAARFVGPHEVDVRGRRLTSPKVFIATGMRPEIPDIAGLEAVPYLTNENVMDLTEVPAHLVVVGGGYIGAELAQAYRRFGAEVTLITRNARLLPGEEPEASETLAEAFRAEGIRLLLGTAATAVEPGIRVRAGAEVIAGSHLLVATGRQPNTDTLDLDRAGVSVRSDGAIAVDARMRTNVEGVWAIGDVNGEQPFTRVCQEEAKVAFADAFGRGTDGIDRLPLGHAIFTDPEIGSVGLTEAAARAAGRDIVAGTVDLGQVEKAELIGETRGLIKVVVERDTRKLLGLHVVGPSAADLVYDAALVIRRRGTIDEIATTVGIFPTLQEGVEGTARAMLRHLAPERAATLTGSPLHHGEHSSTLACPSCAAEYQVHPASSDNPSFGCPSCASEYEIATPEPATPQPIQMLDAAESQSFACPACAAEFVARTSA